MITLPSIGYAGRYRLKKVREGYVTYDSGWFSNLITDGGLDQFADITPGTGGIPYIITQAYVGTGNVTPEFTDTSLSSYLASSNVIEAGGNNSYIAGLTPYWRHIRTFTFAVGTVTGVLAEVGVGNSKDTLFSRALLLDSLGAITTVQVLADEGIQLTYELRSYINSEDVLSSNTFSGNLPDSDVYHSFIIRPAAMNVSKFLNIGMNYAYNNVALYSGNIQSNIQVPAGFATSITTYVASGTYTPGSFSLFFLFPIYEGDGNYPGGVHAVRISNNQCDFQVQVTPPILKTSKHILSIGVSLTWGRYTP